VLLAGGLGGLLVGALAGTQLGSSPPPGLPAHAVDLGRLLFTEYLLPFEMLSVLLLVAMVGVILLSRKEPE